MGVRRGHSRMARPADRRETPARSYHPRVPHPPLSIPAKACPVPRYGAGIQGRGHSRITPPRVTQPPHTSIPAKAGIQGRGAPSPNHPHPTCRTLTHPKPCHNPLARNPLPQLPSPHDTRTHHRRPHPHTHHERAPKNAQNATRRSPYPTGKGSHPPQRVQSSRICKPPFRRGLILQNFTWHDSNRIESRRPAPPASKSVTILKHIPAAAALLCLQRARHAVPL